MHYYTSYIDRIERKLIKDLVNEFPDFDVNEDDAVWDILTGKRSILAEVCLMLWSGQWGNKVHPLH